MALPRTVDRSSWSHLSALERGLRGRVIRPSDATVYDAARGVWNARFDRYPAAIVQPADASDVVRAVTIAAETGMPLSVRGGGHSLAGFGTVDDGLVLDMSGMRALHIDPQRRLAWAGPGLTAGEYTTAAAEHGLATPFGDTGSVGIGGLTLGGGIGWLVRKHGLAIDNLVSVELVTADGRLLRASADEHPDLFWAVRGGGGNFGVVTRFQYRLQPLPSILGGAIFLPPTRDVLAGLVPAASAAPDELSTISFLMPAPPLPFVPVEQHGKPTLIVMFVWAGEPEAGDAALAPIRALAQPVADVAMPMPYPGIYDFTAEAAARHGSVSRSMFADDLSDSSIDAIADFGVERAAAFGGMTQIRILGGEMARVGRDDTAFAHRDRNVMVLVTAGVDDPATADDVRTWRDDYFSALRPDARGVYVNFVEDEGDTRIREAYPGATYGRLAAVKRRYDPGNLFSLNQNIRPSSN